MVRAIKSYQEPIEDLMSYIQIYWQRRNENSEDNFGKSSHINKLNEFGEDMDNEVNISGYFYTYSHVYISGNLLGCKLCIEMIH